MRKYIAIFMLTGVAGVGIAFFFWPNAADPTFADATDKRLVSQGDKIYSEYCAACHGANLEGQPNWRLRRSDGRLPAPPHDATGHTWHHPDTQLFQVTKFGTAAIAGPGYKTDMAAFGDVLSDAEIWAVLAYIKSRWPESIRQRHADINKQ